MFDKLRNNLYYVTGHTFGDQEQHIDGTEDPALVSSMLDATTVAEDPALMSTMLHVNSVAEDPALVSAMLHATSVAEDPARGEYQFI